MTIFLCGLIMLLSYYIGKKSISKDKSRVEFWKDMINFLNYVKVNINFLLVKKETLILNYKEKCGRDFKFFLEQNGECENINFLSEIQIKECKEILNFIGTTNVEGQNAFIESKLIEFQKQLIFSEQTFVKNQKWVLKTSLSVGLLICILII